MCGKHWGGGDFCTHCGAPHSALAVQQNGFCRRESCGVCGGPLAWGQVACPVCDTRVKLLSPPGW